MEVDDQIELLVAALTAVVDGAAPSAAAIDTAERARLAAGKWQREAAGAELDVVSLHESAHAVVSIRLGRPIQCLLLRRDGTGEVRFDPHPLALDAFTTAVINLAGPVAELRAGAELSRQELARSGDVLKARSAIDRCGITPRAVVTIACASVEGSWGAIGRVARAARARGELSGLEVIFAMYGGSA